MFEYCLFGFQAKSTDTNEHPMSQRYACPQTDFLYLCKCILYRSFELAYYSSFIPIMFIPSTLAIYFDTFAVMVFTVFLLVNSFAILASHYLQQRIVEN